MHRAFLILRTLRHVKPIQIWNRIWRKRLSLFAQVKRPNNLKSGNLSPLPEFTFLNTTARPEGWNDRQREKLWLYNLHYFDYLDKEKWRNEVEVDSGIEASALVLRWIDENPVGWGNGWEPYPISLRVVNWIKWLERDRAKSADASETNVSASCREKIETSLRAQVAFLLPRLEYHLLANHLLANAKALVFAGAYLKERRWLEKGLAIYRKELPEQTCADGVHFERSPMYHSIILEDVLDCVEEVKVESSKFKVQGSKFKVQGSRFNVQGSKFKVQSSKFKVQGSKLERCEVEALELFRTFAERMLMGLKILIGPDGQIAKFNDSTEGIARSPAYLFDFARKLGIEPPSPTSNLQPPTFNLQSSSGFIRTEAGTYTLLAKCGAIGPDYQPGHAHADTFSFELWRGAEKIVGDTGCSTYIPGSIRRYERSTAAHNTVVIDGQDSSEVWAAHRVGRRFDFGRHRRRFELTQEGLKGTDEIFGKGKHRVEARFHLPPGVAPEKVAISCPGERTVETCDFAQGWNLRAKGVCITYRQTVELPTQIEWSVT